MSTGTTDKKIEKKKKILETAYNLFMTKSVNATAIDDVVKSAGIARGTFYLYFKDKSDLLEQIILFKSTEYMKQLICNVEKQIEEEKPGFRDEIKLFVDMYINFLAEHKDVLMVLNKNISSCLKMYPEFYDAEAKELFDKIVARFEKNGFSIEEAHKVIYIVVEAIGSVCTDAILYSKPFALEDIRPELTDFVLDIIGNRIKKTGESIA